MSTNFAKLEEEEVKIEVINDNNTVNIILRNLNNENTNYLLEKSKIKKTSELRSDVNILKQIMSKLKISSDKTIKLFFKGKILVDTTNVEDYSTNNLNQNSQQMTLSYI